MNVVLGIAIYLALGLVTGIIADRVNATNPRSFRFDPYETGVCVLFWPFTLIIGLMIVFGKAVQLIVGHR